MSWDYELIDGYWAISKTAELGTEIIFTAKDEAWAAHLVEVMTAVDELAESNRRRREQFKDGVVIPLMQKYSILGDLNVGGSDE